MAWYCTNHKSKIKLVSIGINSEKWSSRLYTRYRRQVKQQQQRKEQILKKFIVPKAAYYSCLHVVKLIS